MESLLRALIGLYIKDSAMEGMGCVLENMQERYPVLVNSELTPESRRTSGKIKLSL